MIVSASDIVVRIKWFNACKVFLVVHALAISSLFSLLILLVCDMSGY